MLDVVRIVGRFLGTVQGFVDAERSIVEVRWSVMCLKEHRRLGHLVPYLQREVDCRKGSLRNSNSDHLCRIYS